MTEMSEPHCAPSRLSAHNALDPLYGFDLARGVHDPASLVLSLSLLALLTACLAGCILPPSLSTEKQDAGVNSPPAITAVRTDADDLFEPGPVALTRGSGTINFELLDTDVSDMLVIRVFINYRIDDPTPQRTQCTAPATGEPTRTVTCAAGTICQMADDGQTRNMTAVVFDRALAESGKPEFQAMDGVGGLSTSRFFFVNCAGPQL